MAWQVVGQLIWKWIVPGLEILGVLIFFSPYFGAIGSRNKAPFDIHYAFFQESIVAVVMVEGGQ